MIKARHINEFIFCFIVCTKFQPNNTVNYYMKSLLLCKLYEVLSFFGELVVRFRSCIMVLFSLKGLNLSTLVTLAFSLSRKTPFFWKCRYLSVITFLFYYRISKVHFFFYSQPVIAKF